MKKQHLGWFALAIVLTAAVTWAGVANKAAVFDGIVETTSGGYMFPDGSLQTTGIVVAAASKTCEFVGTSSAKSPDSGVLALTSHCQAEFGADARMCTSEEVLNTVAVPSPANWQTTIAFVRPIPMAFGIHTSTNLLLIADSSGVPAVQPEALTCAAWRRTTGGITGLTVEMPEAGREGIFDFRFCDSPAGVACCAPVSP